MEVVEVATSVNIYAYVEVEVEVNARSKDNFVEPKAKRNPQDISKGPRQNLLKTRGNFKV